MQGTLYTGGTIYTMEPGVSVVEAVLVENGRIQAVGKRAEPGKRRGESCGFGRKNHAAGIY
ncbi:hypothetical protein [Gallintestinimicrobium sp.]|uniref:hypothetical protein n=1 Tax=Gallintestinimicrobium sp. TaxID=2981655 RepID=UPI00399C27F9